ncbi:MAG: DUF6371 domain-containing protein [bacterium]|nr:DUF6371 domain-containing protein [bacterium]
MFTLDKRPNKKKYECPNCCHKKKFTRYIHDETLDELNDEVGICDRSDNCGYHYPPKQYFEDNKGQEFGFRGNYPIVSNSKIIITPSISFVEQRHLELSIGKIHIVKNCFHQFLTDCFGNYAADNVCRRYKVGNSNRWNGGNVFWQVDINQKIRTGKIMLYDAASGKRTPKYENWVHHILKDKGLISNFHLNQCFFGEHILKYETTMPIAIVESVKTAIICYLFMPQYIWLASGGEHGLNKNKFISLKNRKIILFPDLNKYSKWNRIAVELRNSLGLNITASSMLEKIALVEDISNGFDLADYLLIRNDLGEAMHETGIPMDEYLFDNHGHWVDSVQL